MCAPPPLPPHPALFFPLADFCLLSVVKGPFGPYKGTWRKLLTVSLPGDIVRKYLNIYMQIQYVHWSLHICCKKESKLMLFFANQCFGSGFSESGSVYRMLLSPHLIQKMLAWLGPDPDSLTQVNLDSIRIRVRILNTIVNPKFQGASLVLLLLSLNQALPIFSGTSMRESPSTFWLTQHPFHSALQCNEKPIYVFPEKELRGHSPNFHMHVSVSDLYIPRIGPAYFSAAE